MCFGCLNLQPFLFSVSGLIRFDLTLVTIHTQPNKTKDGEKTRQEINGLHNFINRILNPPLCYSGNAIIMGDFNQGTNYVKDTWQSLLDKSPEYNELTYAGGSTSATKPPQKHDRLVSIAIWSRYGFIV